MDDRIRGLRAALACLVVALIPLTLAACGSSGSSGSSGNAAALLSQTFSGAHAVNSGNLTFSLTVTPSGSKTLTGPITLSFGGPFQSLGKGKLPKSNFTVSASALGKSVSLGILSTGTAGYVSLQGTSYQLPTATFQKLESSFASFASTGSGGSSSNALTKLGIKPLHWLTSPRVVGNESVAGASTTHITAGLNVPSLLDDVNTLLSKAGSLGLSSTGSLPTSISAATRSKIAAAVRNPTIDVWTGTSDKTLRRVTLRLTLPVSGQASSLLGGMTAASLALTIQYASLNQPQTITAPTSTAPYSQFTAKLQQFVQTLQSTVAAEATGLGGGTTTTPSTGTAPATGTGTGTGTGGGSTTLDPYTQCIQSASTPLKAQKCAKLLNGGGG
jgi:hypothetical protein